MGWGVGRKKGDWWWIWWWRREWGCEVVWWCRGRSGGLGGSGEEGYKEFVTRVMDDIR